MAISGAEAPKQVRTIDHTVEGPPFAARLPLAAFAKTLTLLERGSYGTPAEVHIPSHARSSNHIRYPARHRLCVSVSLTAED
jgi:hypothetical protein